MSESTHNPLGAADTDIDAQVQRELTEGLGEQSADELMEQSAAAAGAAAAEKAETKEIEYEMARGRISAVTGDDVFVELAGMAGKNQGVVPLLQFDRPPRVGSIMDFVVERYDEAEGLVVLSREGAVSRATWEQLQRGARVEARVISHNKGGLELEMIGGIRAFMPASQIDLGRTDDMESFVGQKLHAIVQEIDRKSKKVVVSRRKYLEAERKKQQEETLATLEVDQMREGVVRSVVDFGAFVDLGGVDGLIHISDLSYQRVKKPSEVVKVGDKVSVKVLKIDKENQRISLGLKQVEPDPWETVPQRYSVGEEVSGRVVRLAEFGAFVEVEAGIEALLPISEMSWKRIHKPSEVVKEGDVIRVSLLALDPEKRRMTLSLKAAQGDPWAEATAKYPANSKVQGRVVRIVDFGAFVEIETGVEGLVHISELSDKRVGKVEDVLKVGDTREFRVLELDTENRRIRLSLKSGDRADAQQATPEQIRQANKPRTPRKDLRGGMDIGGFGGIGLRDLRL